MGMRVNRLRRFAAPFVALAYWLAGVTGGAAATLPPSISKGFGAAAIPLNGTTSLTITITNPNAEPVNRRHSDTIPLARL